MVKNDAQCKGIPTKEEWNALDKEEQLYRVRLYVKHELEREENGLPTDRTSLMELAEYYGTPVPNIKETGEYDFSGYGLLGEK